MHDAPRRRDDRIDFFILWLLLLQVASVTITVVGDDVACLLVGVGCWVVESN